MVPDGYKHSAAVTEDLELLQAHFAGSTGRRFVGFYCPILLAEEDVPLCMGHIVNASVPNSFRGRIPQRQDVDQFYGAFFEADFTGKVVARSMGLEKAINDPKMRKKLGLRLMLNGEEVPHYEDRGVEVRGHTQWSIVFGDGKPLRLMLKKSPEELEAMGERSIEVKFGRDNRIEALVSTMKAAYLTLFKLIGYPYAGNRDGSMIGYGALGRFFRENAGKRKVEVREAAKTFFLPYANMMRTVERYEGKQPLGTVEDGWGKICSAGELVFGIIVTIRTDKQFFDVLMPYFDDIRGIEAYREFMGNHDQSLRVHNCKIENMQMTVAAQTKERFWPKGEAFRFDD
jgi:hypothetical protein